MHGLSEDEIIQDDGLDLCVTPGLGSSKTANLQ